MSEDPLPELRQRAQEAISRARLARDQHVKEQWAEIAKVWMQLLEAAGEKPLPPSGRPA